MKAKLTQTFRNIDTGKTLIMLETDGRPDLDELKGKDLEVDMKPWRNRRSKDANALFWACVGELAKALRADKWEIYLSLLKSYGKFSYVIVPTGAVEKMQRMWRETEIVGDIVVNGRKAVQMLCYYGSSVYNTEEMSALIDGTISEMMQVGLPRPDGGEIRRALKEWTRSSKAGSTASSAEGQTD